VIGHSKSPFLHVVEGSERSLFLGPFLEAGRVPSIAGVEIAVCFADLRGFTRYVHALQSNWQDSRAQEFIGAYFRLYPRAVLELVYSLEPEVGSEISAQSEQVRRLIVPSTFKTLGDGMMLVWETQGERRVQDLVAARILQIVAALQRLFRKLIADTAKTAPKPYSAGISELRLGFGLARGHAWRLDFGQQRSVDYAGSVVNLAARLQDLARPEGIVAEVGFCDPVLRKSPGKRGRVTVPGMDKPVEVWASSMVDFGCLKRATKLRGRTSRRRAMK
jgi:class 3 adenylate cyclase